MDSVIGTERCSNLEEAATQAVPYVATGSWTRESEATEKLFLRGAALPSAVVIALFLIGFTGAEKARFVTGYAFGHTVIRLRWGSALSRVFSPSRVPKWRRNVLKNQSFGRELE
jgi:hypothetical protein